MEQINLENRFVLYIHGFKERITDESVQTIVSGKLIVN